MDVSLMCDELHVSRSGYYNHLRILRRPISMAEMRDRDLVRWAYDFKGRAKGARQIKMTLSREKGVKMNLKKIRRIMKDIGIACPIRKANPLRRMAKAMKTNVIFLNKLNRQFRTSRPGQHLLTDITYVYYGANYRCYLIHRPDIFMDNEEVARAVKYLLDKGLIREFGVSNFSVSEIRYLQEKLPCPIKYDQVQLGIGNTDMIDQTMYTNIPGRKAVKGPDDLFFYLKRKNITIQCWSPYQYGLFQGSIFRRWRHPRINHCLDKFAAKYNTSPCAIATAFLLKLDKNLLVITGSTDIGHIKDSLKGESVNLTKEDWYRIYKETGHMLP